MAWEDSGGERMPSMRANICAALNFGLFDGDGTHLFLVIEFGEDGAHHLTCVTTLAYCSLAPAIATRYAGRAIADRNKNLRIRCNKTNLFWVCGRIKRRSK